jgi:hypothetical protein
MTDKELLMFAAKAVGIKLLYCPDVLPRDCTGMHELMNIFAAPVWNPLANDGDALRLAVKLGISVPTKWDNELMDKYGLDVYSATRRVIVRAAAEIGKAMP